MKTPRLRTPAFSLVELLVVVAVIGIIATFAVPAVQGILKGSALTQASSLLTDQMSFARQYALTKNRIVEVRFYRFADPELPGEAVSDPKTGHFRAFQIFERYETGDVVPIGKGIHRMPDSIIMNPGENLSNLLTEDPDKIEDKPDQGKDPELPRGIGYHYEYVAFQFRPDGTTSLSPTGTDGEPSQGGRWFITLHATADLNRTENNTKPPPNFFTWMIDPVSGTTKVFRPGLN